MKLIIEDEHGEQRVELDADILHLRPGDLVLLCCRNRLSSDSVQAIREVWEAQFPDVKAVILDGGIEPKVLRKEVPA